VNADESPVNVRAHSAFRREQTTSPCVSCSTAENPLIAHVANLANEFPSRHTAKSAAILASVVYHMMCSHRRTPQYLVWII
jgi:hypothetical protein